MAIDPDPEPLPATPPSPPTNVEVVQAAGSGRLKRSRRLPARYREALPTPPIPVTNSPPKPESTGSRIKRLTLIVQDRFITAIYIFGIW